MTDEVTTVQILRALDEAEATVAYRAGVQAAVLSGYEAGADAQRARDVAICEELAAALPNAQHELLAAARRIRSAVPSTDLTGGSTAAANDTRTLGEE